jgi:hypothetical protein
MKKAAPVKRRRFYFIRLGIFLLSMGGLDPPIREF